jgi:hypothetical protein
MVSQLIDEEFKPPERACTMQDFDSRPNEQQQEANQKMRKSESALQIEPYTPLRIRIESIDSDVLDIVPKTAQPQLKHTSDDTSVSGA